jgi:hypothetical protein
MALEHMEHVNPVAMISAFFTWANVVLAANKKLAMAIKIIFFIG